MIKTDYEVRAKAFIKEFAPYLKGIRVTRSNSYKIRDAVRRFNVDKKRNVKVDSGASRIVLITSDYVVKLDFGTTWAGNSKSEMLGYQQAQKDGYEYLLAKISLYKYHNRSFFIMPRARVAGTLTWQGQKKLWFKLTDKEQDYLRNNFDDLHNNNWGSLNGRPVLIDYAWNDFKYLL
mgnify:CR=1 FL=1